MKLGDLLELTVLAALWGASFLFMRVAVSEFGPVALAAARVLIAALVLLPIFTAGGGLAQLGASARPIFVVGALNVALPFTLFAYATLSLTAGFASILNATAPFFTAIVGYLWLKERLTAPQIAGLFIGFAGVALLVWGNTAHAAGGAWLAVAAALVATCSYGIAANYAKRRLAGVSPMVTAAGSQIAASLCLLPLAAWRLPPVAPSGQAWLAAGALGVFSTAAAFVLYFRLIRNAGANRAMTVTFLIPVFGMLWGMLLLDETVTLNMIAGTVIILAGTALTTGAWPRHRPRVA